MSYTKEEVKRWFSDLDVKEELTPVKLHLESLMKYGNNPVKSWTKIFVDCMVDIGCFNEDYYENDKNMFLTKTNLTAKQLNEMNKREFVELFSKTIKSILENRTATTATTPPTDTPVIKELDHNGCIKGEEVWLPLSRYCAKIKDLVKSGGSKKKPHKRATRRSRRSRRNETRKYKKYNKR